MTIKLFLMDFNLVEEALRASGIEDDERLAGYVRDLDLLLQKFIPSVKDIRDPVAKARTLFEWLWSEKSARYKSGGRFRLHQVIEAQMSQYSRSVGNCLGLTLLYNCLLGKMGVKPGALYLENAFGIGPHILTFLQTDESTIDIENIFPDGFDYKGHLGNPDRIKWGDRELVADIYHSLGNECFEKGEYVEALKNYEMSIKLNPEYEKACLNRAILLDKMEADKRAG